MELEKHQEEFRQKLANLDGIRQQRIGMGIAVGVLVKGYEDLAELCIPRTGGIVDHDYGRGYLDGYVNAVEDLLRGAKQINEIQMQDLFELTQWAKRVNKAIYDEDDYDD